MMLKTFLLLGLLILNTAFAEVEKGSCIVKVNGVEMNQRISMWDGENVVAPILIETRDSFGKARKFRIIYDYSHLDKIITLKFVDCDKPYQPPRTQMKICSHIFTSTHPTPLNKSFTVQFGGEHSYEPEIQLSCIRLRD
jgi:hypothetical protein